MNWWKKIGLYTGTFLVSCAISAGIAYFLTQSFQFQLPASSGINGSMPNGAVPVPPPSDGKDPIMIQTPAGGESK